MNLYLVLLLSVLSAVHWSYGQDQVEEDMVVAHHFHPLGSWTAVDINRTDIQKGARIAVEKFNLKSKAKKYFKLVDVTSAKTKVTNLINYKIDVNIRKTTCLKPEPVDLDSCEMARKRLRCKFEVMFNPRDDQYEVEFVSCNK